MLTKSDENQKGKPNENHHKTSKQDKDNNPNIEENIFTQETKTENTFSTQKIEMKRSN